MSVLIRKTAPISTTMLRAMFSTTSITTSPTTETVGVGGNNLAAVASSSTSSQQLQQQQQQPLPISQIQVPKSYNLRGSRKRLIHNGVQALLPTVQIRYPENYMNNNNEVTNIDALPGSEKLWKAPKISRRKIAVLRKEAIRTGTYGTFDATKGGIGWDPMWDIELMKHTSNTLGRYMSLRVPKKTSRMRTRALRAQKIDTAMIDMDSKIEELQAAKHRNKPPVTFESTFKKLMKVKK